MNDVPSETSREGAGAVDRGLLDSASVAGQLISSSTTSTVLPDFNAAATSTICFSEILDTPGVEMSTAAAVAEKPFCTEDGAEAPISKTATC